MLDAEEFTVVMPCTSSEIRNVNGRIDLTMTGIIPEKLQCLEQTTALVATVLQPFRSFILPLIKHFPYIMNLCMLTHSLNPQLSD
jgi:hypothetical protein